MNVFADVDDALVGNEESVPVLLFWEMDGEIGELRSDELLAGITAAAATGAAPSPEATRLSGKMSTLGGNGVRLLGALPKTLPINDLALDTLTCAIAF